LAIAASMSPRSGGTSTFDNHLKGSSSKRYSEVAEAMSNRRYHPSEETSDATIRRDWSTCKQQGRRLTRWAGPDVLSPTLIQSSSHDSYEVEDKIAQWLGAGVRLVWVLSPEMQRVQVPPPRAFRTPTH